MGTSGPKSYFLRKKKGIPLLKYIGYYSLGVYTVNIR
jgi:hypothetical protein